MRKISTIVASIIVSAITAKIVATYYFKKVQGKKAIDCAVRHISALFHQCAEHREADFAAVVKLIDDFSNPSREVAAQARDLEKRFNSVAGVFSHAGEAFTAAGETLTKSVTAPLVAVGTAAIKFSSDSQDTFQQFAAATGTASNEMGKYKDMINDIYKNNFGESINDVAEAMATVNQNMSYLDDSALQRCTEYAYTLWEDAQNRAQIAVLRFAEDAVLHARQIVLLIAEIHVKIHAMQLTE